MVQYVALPEGRSEGRKKTQQFTDITENEELSGSFCQCSCSLGDVTALLCFPPALIPCSGEYLLYQLSCAARMVAQGLGTSSVQGSEGQGFQQFGLYAAFTLSFVSSPVLI